MTTGGTTSSRRQRHSAPGFDSAGSVAGDDETQGADWKNEGYDFTPDPDAVDVCYSVAHVGAAPAGQRGCRSLE
jgi:hypothetical protein